MDKSPEPDLIKVTEIFLIPSSFLVAALGTADTNWHRAAVSLIGLLMSVLWWVCSREAAAETASTDAPTGNPARLTRRRRIMLWLPSIFMAAWLVSAVAHAMLGNQKLGT